MSSQSSSKPLSDHMSLWLQTQTGFIQQIFDHFLWVIPCVSCCWFNREESGQGSLLYIPKLDGIVRSVLYSQLPEDVLMAVTGAEFACVQLSFSKHLYGAKYFFSMAGLHSGHIIHWPSPHRYYRLLRKDQYLDRSKYMTHSLRPWVPG